MLNSKRRRIAYQNIKRAFGNRYTESERIAIVKKSYVNLLQTCIEVARLPKVDKPYIDKYIKVHGREKIDEALSRGKGVIFLTGHFGNWEITNVAAAIEGYKINPLARDQKMPRLNNLLNKYRESSGSKVITKGFSTRQIVKCLTANETVGILSDQDAGKNGIFVKLFGLPTSTHKGAVRFAFKTGATILPVFITRSKGPYHEIFVEDPILVNDMGGNEKTIQHYTQIFSNQLEKYITKYPEQWLWMHKRWKSIPRKKILILSDGKAGHLNQSKEIARLIVKGRVEKGYAPNDTEIDTMVFKNLSGLKFYRFILLSYLKRYDPGIIIKTMAHILSKEKYKTLSELNPDYVVSCGHRLSHINFIVARENLAKSIIIMKPPLFKLRLFDLCILPRHDRVKSHRKVVFTLGAINGIRDKLVSMNPGSIRSKWNLPDSKYIALLLGGDNAYYTFTLKRAQEICTSTLEKAKGEGAYVLITTSRRTPKKVENYLKELSQKESIIKMCVIANDKNYDGIVEEFLCLSDLIITTGESISMVSESASSGKPTVVYRLEPKNENLIKHDKFINELSEAKHIKFVNIREKLMIGESLSQLKKLDDSKNIYRKVQEIV